MCVCEYIYIYIYIHTYIHTHKQVVQVLSLNQKKKS